MMAVAEIRELYRYNQWANDRVLDAVAVLDVKDFTRELGNSFPSVRDTLVHIIWAEWIWLQRWKGTFPRHMFDPKDFSDVEHVKARWSDLKTEQQAFVEAVTADRLGAIGTYVNMKGETWRYVFWRQMYHVVNHSTYHRGQVTTMLRQLNAMPVNTDFLVFHDELELTSRGFV